MGNEGKERVIYIVLSKLKVYKEIWLVQMLTFW